MATAKKPPYTFLLLVKTLPLLSASLSLLHLILPSYNWTSSPPRNLSFTHIHFLHKHFTLLSLKMTKPSQSIYVFTHSTSLRLCMYVWCLYLTFPSLLHSIYLSSLTQFLLYSSIFFSLYSFTHILFFHIIFDLLKNKTYIIERVFSVHRVAK